MPSNLTISSGVDYPYGLSDTKIRQHHTISLIRRGATAIDLVVNPVHLINNNRHLLMDDIQANRAICIDNNIIFRVMLEYRHFSQDIYYEMVKICKLLKLPYIFPSTGHFPDDYIDNLIVCKLIQNEYTEAKLITNGNIWQKKHYDIIKESNIYGLRMQSGYDFGVLYIDRT